VEQLASFVFNQVLSGSRKAVARSPKQIYLDLYRHKPYAIPASLSKIDALLKSYPEISILSINEQIDLLRMYKDDFEISETKRAIGFSKIGIESILKTATPGINERAIVAQYEFALKSAGSEGNSFNPIVASGANATTLHYEENNQNALDGSLVLLDMGALAGPYASDISRTFPVNGHFSARQKQLYELVLSVNKACIEFVKPGLMMAELNQHAKDLLAEGALKIGLIDKLEDIGLYYYHNVSHYLGLDVHDVGTYLVPLQPGVILTIEPGIYIEAEGIGIRIEDNVLVTENGRENLSVSIIKEVKDIEKFMSKK
jgi:Xaa-Pro aminopeptidase